MFLVCAVYATQSKFSINGEAQGTTYHIQYWASDPVISKAQVDSVLDIIDRSMSLYNRHSTIVAFNRLENEVEMDEHMANVLKCAFEVGRVSNGIFDITVMPLVSLWGYGPLRINSLPDGEVIDSVLKFVGMDKLILQGNTLKKTDKRVQIDLNGIAQGYSVDVIARFLDQYGIRNYLVELGGEIKTKGGKGVCQPFEIAIESPQNGRYADVILQLKDEAVTTSGNYRRAFDWKGRRIHHHINPRDGYPVKNNVASVTVIAPTAMEADAYDNVFMALTPEESIRLANGLQDIEVYIIYNDGEGLKEFFSKGFHRYIKSKQSI